jgi:expansin (peptidoglycan-binding protein)
VTSTHRSTEGGGRRGKWLIGWIAVGVIATTGVIATMALGSTPQRETVAGYTAVSTSAPPISATTAGTAASSPTAGTPSPNNAATATSAKPSAAKPSATNASSAASTGDSSQGSTSASASLTGRIRPGVTYNGVATEYAAADGDGACLFGPAATMMIAAMNYLDYENSKACGDHILVRASDGATITVLITNECPLPCAPGQLDLSQQAFAKLANPNAGRISVTWQLLSPADAGTISFRYQTGSSQWWCNIQTIGQRNPVAELEVHTSSGWTQLPRTSYNYFQSAHGTGCGSEIRITDIYGQQLIASGISIQPNVVQPTQLQFAQH